MTSNEEIVEFFSYTEVPKGLKYMQAHTIADPVKFVVSHLTVLTKTQVRERKHSQSYIMHRFRLMKVMRILKQQQHEGKTETVQHQSRQDHRKAG